VFSDLARQAGRLAPNTILTSWLYQVTRRSAIDVVRRESRRQLREKTALELAAMNTPSADWAHIEPLLDEAMQELDEPDRAAVLLRYFENKSLREVGQALGASEEAARKRIGRAVERLRALLAKRGVTVGASGLVVLLSVNAVQAAPAGLLATLSSTIVSAATGATTAATLTQTIAMTTLHKTLLAALAVAVSTGIYQARQTSHLRGQVQTLRQQQSPLAEQLQQLTRERDEATNRLAQEAHSAELLRLRGEVGMLRQRTNELQSKVSQAAHPLPEQTHFPKDAWAFAGYATPEAAFQSTMWAKASGDVNTFLSSQTAQVKSELETNYVKGETDEDKSAFLKSSCLQFKGFQLLNEIPIGDDQVMLQTRMDIADGTNTHKFYDIAVMKNVDGQWRSSQEYISSGFGEPRDGDAP
jgi:RNA polymerase sigma factor (sigma-70 family)